MNQGTACRAADCPRLGKVRHLCPRHYARLLRWGDPLGRKPRESVESRFWRKVNKEGPKPPWLTHRGTCWQWMAGQNGTGYGNFDPAKGIRVLAHRYAYTLLRGPIPIGLVLDHLCRNRRCVNPDHLEAVTLAENIRRGLSVSTFNRLKTHCPHGHEYSKANTYIRPKGGRVCRACARIGESKRVRSYAKKVAA